LDHESDSLGRVLQRLPVPEPRPGFVDRAIARATGETATRAPARGVAPAWQAWIGAALGAVVTAAAMLLFQRPQVPPEAPATGITLAVNESRNVDVLIDSERELEDATIRIALTGGIAVDGFGNERSLHWRTRLDQGRNVLSLPVVAQSPGPGRLVAVVEHGGRTRRVTIDLAVVGKPEAKS